MAVVALATKRWVPNTKLPLQCMLRLAPDVDCNSSTYWIVLAALAIPTFLSLTLIYPIAVHWLLHRDPTNSPLAASISYLNAAQSASVPYSSLALWEKASLRHSCRRGALPR